MVEKEQAVGSCFPKAEDLNIVEILAQISETFDCIEVNHFRSQL